jgi:hypothetical protein
MAGRMREQRPVTPFLCPQCHQPTPGFLVALHPQTGKNADCCEVCNLRWTGSFFHVGRQPATQCLLGHPLPTTHILAGWVKCPTCRAAIGLATEEPVMTVKDAITTLRATSSKETA